MSARIVLATIYFMDINQHLWISWMFLAWLQAALNVIHETQSRPRTVKPRTNTIKPQYKNLYTLKNKTLIWSKYGNEISSNDWLMKRYFHNYNMVDPLEPPRGFLGYLHLFWFEHVHGASTSWTVHPVLPYRIQGKLMFPFCKTCADTCSRTPCTIPITKDLLKERGVVSNWKRLPNSTAYNEVWHLLSKYSNIMSIPSSKSSTTWVGTQKIVPQWKMTTACGRIPWSGRNIVEIQTLHAYIREINSQFILGWVNILTNVKFQAVSELWHMLLIWLKSIQKQV